MLQNHTHLGNILLHRIATDSDDRTESGAAAVRVHHVFVHSSNRGLNTDLTDRSQGPAPARRAWAPTSADRDPMRDGGWRARRGPRTNDCAANDEDSEGGPCGARSYSDTHCRIGRFEVCSPRSRATRTVLWSAVQPESTCDAQRVFSCSSSAWSACKLALRPVFDEVSITPQHNHVSCK